MPNYEKLSTAVVGSILLGQQARQLADHLTGHLDGIADHRDRAALHRIGVVLRDFGLAIGHAEAGMSDTVKAAIAAR